MNPRIALLAGLTASLSFHGSVRSQNVEIYGANFLSGTAYRIDPADAANTVIGTTGFANIGAVCKDGTGTIWAHSNFQRKLLTLDPDTGAGTFVADTFRTVRGMDFVGGTLYAIADGGFNNDDRLYTINTSDGSSTLIGNTSHERIEAFAIAGGQAYAWDQVAGLLTVNLANGDTTNVSGVNDGGFDIHALAVSPGGTLYGAWENLYTIDTGSGAHTIVDDLLGFVDLDGMVFHTFPDCLDLDNANLAAGQVATLSTSGLPDGTFLATLWGTNQGTTPIALPPLACATLDIAPTGLTVLDIGAVAGGSYDINLALPAGLAGALIYFQSAQLFSCPAECVSNLKSKIL